MEVRAIAIPFVFCCSYRIICFFGHQHLCGRSICKGSKRFLSFERFQYFSLQVYMALRLQMQIMPQMQITVFPRINAALE